MGTLVLVRHGQSEWNAKGLWTGWTDIPLSEAGKKEAREVGEKLTSLQFNKGYTSNLTRAKQTMEEIQNALHQQFQPLPQKN
jgi:bisphosphoglycerate-dependent phosphoglycerate mutase family 1